MQWTGDEPLRSDLDYNPGDQGSALPWYVIFTLVAAVLTVSAAAVWTLGGTR